MLARVFLNRNSINLSIQVFPKSVNSGRGVNLTNRSTVVKGFILTILWKTLTFNEIYNEKKIDILLAPLMKLLNSCLIKIYSIDRWFLGDAKLLPSLDLLIRASKIHEIQASIKLYFRFNTYLVFSFYTQKLNIYHSVVCRYSSDRRQIPTSNCVFYLSY